MSEKTNRHCINCLSLESEHDVDLGSFRPCPTGEKGKYRYYIAVGFVPATNLEYLERCQIRNENETIR